MKITGMIKTTAIAASFLLSATIATAEGVLDYMPRDSEFVAELNVKEVINSDAFNWVWTNVLGGEQWDGQIEAFQNLTDINLREDIETIAISGHIEEEDSIIIVVEGNIPVKKLTSFVQLSDTYKKTEFNGLTAHHWEDDGGKYAVELGPNRLLVGNTDWRIKESLEAAEKTTSARGIADDLKLSSRIGDAAGWVYVNALGDSELSEVHRVFGLEAGLLTLGVKGEEVSAMGSVKVAQGDADRWVSFIEGMRSIVQLQREEPWLGELVEEIKISKDEAADTVSLSVAMEIQELVETIAALEELDH